MALFLIADKIDAAIAQPLLNPVFLASDLKSLKNYYRIILSLNQVLL